jgi:hypothetical protein
MERHLFILSAILLVSVPNVYALSFQVKLTLNSTQNSVYIPGVGEVASASMGSNTYTSPAHYYLASYLNGVLYGLIFSISTPVSISVENSSGNHSLTLSQDIENSNVFLVFSRGSWKEVEKRISSVEKGNFLQEVSPTFGFGTGLYRTVMLLLSYTTLDIQNERIIQKGRHRIVADYINYTTKPVIDVDLLS